MILIILMSVNDKLHGVKSIIITAMMTGIALVIANSWGSAIKSTVTRLVNNFQCGNLLTLEEEADEYKSCQTRQGLLGKYINAIVTSLLLSVIAFLIFGIHPVKRMSIKK